MRHALTCAYVLWGLAAGLLAPAVAVAQQFPAQPIEVIVPWDAGGGADKAARRLARLMQPGLKTPLPVVNVPGAVGQTGLTKMLTAPPDGYALSLLGADTLALLAGEPPPRWDLSDIQPLGIVIRQASAFLVPEASRFKTWTEVEQAAKSATIRVAALGPGTLDDLTIRYFVKTHGLKLAAVPVVKPDDRQWSVVGGYADMLYAAIGDVRALVEAKQMHPMLIVADARDADYKDVPVSAELGFKLAPAQFQMLCVRAGTDPKIVKQLADALADAARSPEYAAHLAEQHALPSSFVPMDRTAAFLDRELKTLRALAAEVGSRAQAPADPPTKRQ